MEIEIFRPVYSEKCLGVQMALKEYVGKYNRVAYRSIDRDLTNYQRLWYC